MPTTELEALCQWLNATDRLKRERYFTLYYNIVAKYLLRYIERQLGASRTASTEDILEEVMLTIYKRCNERQQSANSVFKLSATLDLPKLGALFEKRTSIWGKQARNWSNRAMSFPLDHNTIKSPELDTKAKQLNEEIDDPLKKEAESLQAWCKQQAQEHAFINQTHKIVNLLSKLGIPLSCFLYQTAKNKVIDLKRKKSEQVEVSYEIDLDNDSEQSYSVMIEVDAKILEQWQQGEIDQIDDLKQVFDYLLQSPLREARNRLKQASSRQEKQRAEEQFTKADSDYIEHSTILDMMFEGYTQDEIAEQLGLTRDKVRTRQAQIKTLIEPLKKGDLL